MLSPCQAVLGFLQHHRCFPRAPLVFPASPHPTQFHAAGAGRETQSGSAPLSPCRSTVPAPKGLQCHLATLGRPSQPLPSHASALSPSHPETHPHCPPFVLFPPRDLAPRDISGTSDPFVRVSCDGHALETAIIKKTRFPHWDEVLEFELEEGVPGKGSLVSVEVWDWDMVGKNDFLGRVEFSLDALPRSPAKGWFRLLPFPSAEEDAGGKLGALRLKVRLAEDRILPSMYYQPLIELLVESILPLALLEEISSVESRQDVATKLVKIFLGQGLAVPFLDYLNLREVTKTSKCCPTGQGARAWPSAFPRGLLIIGTRCCLRSGSLSEAQVRESSQELLKGYLSDIMESIIGSVEKCPPIMRVAFKQLHKRVEEQFPEAEHEDVKYIAISGFLFLRFFAPAILTPKLFNLRDQHADTRTSRTLLLLAKAVQSIGNLGLQLGHGKEQWMAPLHPFILPSIARVKDFLDKLIDVDSESGEAQPRTLFHPSVTIKEGYLHKHKAEGLHLLPRFTFKKRYFWLSSETLSYSKSPEWQVRSSIPVQRICAVERVDENAFQQPHMMQIITQDNQGQLRTMYIQCKNVNELNQWLSAVRKASICNERMLPSCHPGAFRGNRWTCCLQPDRTVRGCSRTHSAMTLGDWSDPLDPDAETQMVYGQLLLARDKLRSVHLRGEGRSPLPKLLPLREPLYSQQLEEGYGSSSHGPRGSLDWGDPVHPTRHLGIPPQLPPPSGAGEEGSLQARPAAGMLPSTRAPTP
uniref:RAS protein activator like 1 n=1 Tax=Chelydra serpentina TaxID=8475 RepID=A0A8C3SS35_CHESE